MNQQETIKYLYRQYWQYMIEKNAAGLRRIMTEDYYLLHMTGVRQSREEFLRDLLDGTFNYYTAAHDSIVVRIDGNVAEMIGKSRVTAAVYGRRKNQWRLCGVFSLRNENGDWKLTNSKASTY